MNVQSNVGSWVRQTFVCGFFAFALNGCASTAYNFDDLVPNSQNMPKGNISAPRFGDRKPHEWGRKTPWHYPIHGIDVSKYQANIDWATARANGVSFAFIKATEGGDRVDDMFATNWHGAKQAGVKRSAYHFYYYCRSAREQAKWYIQNVPKDASALPPVLDMEWNDLSPSCKLRPKPEIVRSEMQVFLSMVKNHYGKTPIIYTTVDFFDHNDLRQMKGYTFWLRSVAGHPEEKYGSHPWTFWQYTGTGTIPGIKGDADINVFSGGRDAWKNFAQLN